MDTLDHSRLVARGTGGGLFATLTTCPDVQRSIVLAKRARFALEALDCTTLT